MAPLAVVTGANSGIGRAIALDLAGHGYEVHGTVRSRDRATKLEAMAAERGVDVHLVELDVADDESVRAGLAPIADRVDVLVNNAGVGANGVAEETSTARYLEVMDVNLCGAVRCLQAVLPGMRERRRGAVVNVTSVVGRVASLAQSPYVASKWAFEGLSEGLAQELAPFGIRVAIVEPGVTKSAIFAKSVEDLPSTEGPYGVAYGRMIQMYAAGMGGATDPFEVADVVRHAIETDDPKLRYRVSWGSDPMIAGREAMTDEDWVAMGAIEDDAEYYDRFESAFGVDIRPTVT